MPHRGRTLGLDAGLGALVLVGALHQNRFGGPFATPFNGLPGPTGYVVDTKYGYAINAGAKFNLPMLATGDTLTISAVYAYGADNYTGWTDDGSAGSLCPAPRRRDPCSRHDQCEPVEELQSFGRPAALLAADGPASRVRILWRPEPAGSLFRRPGGHGGHQRGLVAGESAQHRRRGLLEQADRRAR